MSGFWPWMYWFAGFGGPLEPGVSVDITAPTVQALIARAGANEERERGGMVAWSYSRDRIVERRELRAESPELKAARLEQAFRDRHPKLRMVS